MQRIFSIVLKEKSLAYTTNCLFWQIREKVVTPIPLLLNYVNSHLVYKQSADHITSQLKKLSEVRNWEVQCFLEFVDNSYSLNGRQLFFTGRGRFRHVMGPFLQGWLWFCALYNFYSQRFLLAQLFVGAKFCWHNVLLAQLFVCTTFCRLKFLKEELFAGTTVCRRNIFLWHNC